MNSFFKTLALLIVAAILGGSISLQLYKKFGDNSGTSTLSTGGKTENKVNIKNVNVPTFDFSEIAEAITPAVVHITTVVEARGNMHSFGPFDMFGFMNPEDFFAPQVGTGSGVIISDDGYILTNNHVIDQASEIRVTLHDKRELKAEVVGRDQNTDLAIIKVKVKNLQYLGFGNSDELKVGQWVLALGNPFNLNSTITAGIVSAKARNIDIIRKEYGVESFIQTDAAVNPGNSGGALVNVKGELVGINTAIATSSGRYEGYSFAIPSNLAKKVVDDILKCGTVQRGFLGVRISEMTEEIARANGIKDLAGVYVNEATQGGAARDAGIQSGDVITAIDGKKVNSVPELQELVSRKRPGDKVKVDVLRKSKKLSFTVALKNSQGKAEISQDNYASVKEIIGAELQSVSATELKKAGLENGVKVASVGPGRFANAGVPKGFIITKIDRVKVKTPDEAYALLAKAKDAVLIEGYTPQGLKTYFGISLEK